jgi:hypothetical protein
MNNVLFQDPVVAYLQIEVHRSGAMSVAGSVQNKQYALQILEAARESVISHHDTTKVQITPAISTGLQNVSNTL